MGDERPVRGDRPLNVLAHVSHAWPTQRGGSETALHRALAWLVERGHSVRALVLTHRGYPVDGVKYAKQGLAMKNRWWAECDVAITQQGGTGSAVRFADEHGKPLVAYCHNLAYLDGHPELAPTRHRLLANTHHGAELLEADGWAGRVSVLHPPVFAAEWKGKPGAFVTQVNVSALKGGRLFWELARRRPDTKFLAVVGGWGDQLHPDGHADEPKYAESTLRRDTLPNVAIGKRTTSMLTDVYARTRVLIIPTGAVNPKQVGESYGIVAAEALGSGIPVVARRSPGMVELLGDDAGFLLDSDDPAEWLAVLDELADPDRYAEASALARARAVELDPVPELLAFERMLRELADGVPKVDEPEPDDDGFDALRRHPDRMVEA